MLKIPKGLKKKKKKSKKDQELFTEEELEQYKRDLKAKQEAIAAKSDAGESDAASDVEGSAPSAFVINSEEHKRSAGISVNTAVANGGENTTTQKSEEDEEWKKFKALTSGVDTILHKTQDELDRIKKESFYQRLPSAAEKKRLEEEEEARKEAERFEEEKRIAAEREANRDKLAEAVVELSDFEEDNDEEVDDIFGTDYVEAIASGELQLAVVPDSPELEEVDGPDPFDTAYAEKVIVGADKAKGNKKLVSLGAAVEVLSGRVDREHALALSKPKRKQRKGIQNLLLSESVDYEECEIELVTPEPPKNLLDELVSDVPEPDAPIDLSVSLHLHLIHPKKFEEEEEEEQELEANPEIDLSEFDTLKDEEDDEFAELAAESITKPKDEVKVIKEIILPQPAVLEAVELDWAEFESSPDKQNVEGKAKPARPPPPARPATGPHIVPGAIYISDDEGDNAEDDPFNTTYAEQVIKKTTVLEEDDDFDPRAEEVLEPIYETRLPGIVPNLIGEESEDYDPFDTSIVSAIVQAQSTKIKIFERDIIADSKSKNSGIDDDFDPRAGVSIPSDNNADFDPNRRKSSLSLNLQQKSVGFLVPSQNLLEAESSAGGSKKPLTPYYASPNISKESKDPFDTSYVPDSKPTEVELKHLERDLLQKTTLKHSVSDPDFNPRAPSTPVPAEDLLVVKDNYINTKILTPAQETKKFTEETSGDIDPFDTSIAADLRPGQVEIKLLESELLPEIKSEITTGVLDTLTDAQELGLGAKVLTPLAPKREISTLEEIDPFDTSIANNLGPGETEIKLLENELIN